MSRINLPREPAPEISKKEVLPDTKQDDIKDIPKATLYGTRNNLKNIKSFRSSRQNDKLINQKTVFKSDIRKILDYMDINENRLNTQLLVEVSNSAYDFFIYGEKEIREESRYNTVKELLLPYFDNDEFLFTTMLDEVSYKIKKSTFVRRLYRRAKNYFF